MLQAAFHPLAAVPAFPAALVCGETRLEIAPGIETR